MSGSGSPKRLRKDKDQISKLSDTILCFILSFLSTKTAVKTSILSKRWKYLWTKIPALDFTKDSKKSSTTIQYRLLSLEQKICFKNFVDRVLFHNVVSYVERFCLDVHNADVFYVNSWLNDASRREIRELNINFGCNSELRISLPPKLLSGDKLVALKLKGHLTLSSLMFSQLPNLETVHIYNLKFSDDKSMRRLLSSCPVLKELHIVGCSGLPKVLCVESLILESLKIIQEIDAPVSTNFVIKTPNVRYLCLSGKLAQYDIGDMCSLIEADLNVVYDNNADGDDDWADLNVVSDNDVDDDDDQAQKFLRNISRVQTLRLAPRNFIKETEIPLFQNLTYLKQEADAFMCDLLNYTPKLKSLVITWICFMHSFEPEFSPEHLPCLESILVHNSMGESEDYIVFSYLLKAASALKELKIVLDERFSDDILADIYRELLTLPRSSPICEVNIVNLSKGC